MQYSINPYIVNINCPVVVNTVELTMPSFVWAFDEPRLGLQSEALISGTDRVINYLLNHLEIDYNSQFTLVFSDELMDDAQLIGEWSHEGTDELTNSMNGNWYKWNHPNEILPNIYGWLCPALLLYYEHPPEKLYVKIVK